MTLAKPESKNFNFLPGRKLAARDAAHYLGVSQSFLAQARMNGNGPIYAKIGVRVIYDVCDLDEFANSRKRRKTGA